MSKATSSLPLVRWIGKHDLTLLLSAAFVIGGIWMVAMLADGVADGRTQEFDRDLIMALREGGILTILLVPRG